MMITLRQQHSKKISQAFDTHAKSFYQLSDYFISLENIIDVYYVIHVVMLQLY